MRTPGNVCSAHLLIVSLHLLLNTGEVSLIHCTPSNTPTGAPEVCGLQWGELLAGSVLVLFLLCSVYNSGEPSLYMPEGPFGLKLENKGIPRSGSCPQSPCHHF